MLISRDPVKRHKSIFNLIAPIYFILNSTVKKGYKKSIGNVISLVDIKEKSVLDVGTGSAAWGALFMENGAHVHGVDFAPLMINKAKKRYGDTMKFSIGNGMNLSQFDDSSFDIVTASFVLHGFPFKQRDMILKEMHRITKNIIIVNDYYGKTHPIGKFLEFLEGSDYIRFKKHFPGELKDRFPKVIACKAGTSTAVYFAAKDSDSLEAKNCKKEYMIL